MAEVDIFDYVTDRLGELRGEFVTLATSHNDLRVKVAGIQTQVVLVYGILTLMLTGMIGTFFHLIQQLAKLTTHA